MRTELIEAFPCLTVRELSDGYIESHPDPIWDIPPIPLIRAIPLYMLWCVEHKSEEGELRFDNTISALNKYARARRPSVEWQDFRFSCTVKQVAAVKSFLYWCQSELLLDYDPILSRAIKNWESIS
jgi:hypothetical protein